MSDEHAVFYHRALTSFASAVSAQAREVSRAQLELADLHVQLTQRGQQWRVQSEAHEQWAAAQRAQLTQREQQWRAQSDAHEQWAAVQRSKAACRQEQLQELLAADVPGALPHPPLAQGAAVLLAAGAAVGGDGEEETALLLQERHRALATLLEHGRVRQW